MTIISENLHTFYPGPGSWQKKLSPIESFHCGMYPMAAFYFEGRINVKQFIAAMHKTLEQFDFLFARLKEENGAIYASYDPQSNSVIPLEIVVRNDSLKGASTTMTLPSPNDKRMLAGITDQINDLTMAAFKLTIFQDGFSIGYCINHTFMDQSSIVYFFKWLAKKYNDKQDEIELTQPILVDVQNLFYEHENLELISSDLNAFRSYGERVGLSYAPNLTELFSKEKSFNSYIKVRLQFCNSVMEIFKQQSDLIISKNDIIQATLLKIYALTSSLSDEEMLHFGFACNVRKHLGLGEEAIGNIIHFPYFPPLNVRQLREQSILELAQLSRKNVNTISLEDYRNKLIWFKNLFKLSEKSIHYVPLTYVKPTYWGHTNWASFDYQTLKFANSILVALETPPFPAQLKFTLTLPQYRQDEQLLVVPISLPYDKLTVVEQLAINTGLFQVEKVDNI